MSGCFTLNLDELRPKTDHSLGWGRGHDDIYLQGKWTCRSHVSSKATRIQHRAFGGHQENTLQDAVASTSMTMLGFAVGFAKTSGKRWARGYFTYRALTWSCPCVSSTSTFSTPLRIFPWSQMPHPMWPSAHSFPSRAPKYEMVKKKLFLCPVTWAR